MLTLLHDLGNKIIALFVFIIMLPVRLVQFLWNLITG